MLSNNTSNKFEFINFILLYLYILLDFNFIIKNKCMIKLKLLSILKYKFIKATFIYMYEFNYIKYKK